MTGRNSSVMVFVVVALALAIHAPAPVAAEREVEAPTLIEVPKLIGLTLAQAKARLTALGHKGSLWELENTKCADRPRVAEGQICYQFPAPGRQLGTRSPIQILVKGAWKKPPTKPDKKK